MKQVTKKEDHIVGTYQRRKTTLLEQIKEERLHCWNISKKEDHIVGTDQRRKTTLLEQIKEGRQPNATIYDRYFKYKIVSSLNGFHNIICCKNKNRGYSYNNLNSKNRHCHFYI
jgi:hypothetical protein